MTTVLLAEPMLRFQCNLKGCCCKGWGIPLAGNDVAVLVMAFPPEDREDILRGAVFNVNEQGVATTVRLRLEGPQAACQFLLDEGLCGVQVHMGTAILPHLCRAFPAFAMNNGSEIEVYFDPVCPEVLNRIDEDSGPMTFVRVEPPPGSDLALRASRPRGFDDITIGSRPLTFPEFSRIREQILDALSDWSIPAMDRLGQIHLAVSRLIGGEPLDAFAIRREERAEGFDAFFDQCVSCHEANYLGRFWSRFSRFVFDLPLGDLEPEQLVPFLGYDPRWPLRVDLREPALQPLLYRFLAHSFFSTYMRHPETAALSFSYGTITHGLGTALRFALAFGRYLDRAIDRTVLKVGLGVADLFYRHNKIPAEAMPWFNQEIPPSPG